MQASKQNLLVQILLSVLIVESNILILLVDFLAHLSFYYDWQNAKLDWSKIASVRNSKSMITILKFLTLNSNPVISSVCFYMFNDLEFCILSMNFLSLH